MFSLGLELGQHEPKVEQRSNTQAQREPFPYLDPHPARRPIRISPNKMEPFKADEEPREGKVRWRQTLPIGISTIIIPYATGAAFALYLYDINNRDGFAPPDKIAFILFIASSMSFTAFPVLASILKSTDLLFLPIGTLTISCAAIDDIMGWCSLALASAFAKGSGIVGLW